MSVVVVDRVNDTRVVKVTPQKGNTFFVVQQVNGQAVIKLGEHATLSAARSAIGVDRKAEAAAKAPVTKPKSAYPQYTGTGKGK